VSEFSISSLLPMLPWEGPPLPRFLGIYWPQQQSSGFLALPGPPRLFRGIEEGERSMFQGSTSLATYHNEESWEIEWSSEGLPTKIVVHREAVKNGQNYS